MSIIALFVVVSIAAACSMRISLRYTPIVIPVVFLNSLHTYSRLLPVDAICDAMFVFGLGEKMTVLSRKYSQHKYKCFCQMADYLQVSKTALSYRMEQLGLLERNLLVKEAIEKKGAA